MIRYKNSKILKKESTGIVQRVVDDGGIKTFWDDAFTLAVEDLKDQYSIEESVDGFYVALQSRFGDELSYQGYVAFDRVDGDRLILHAVYPDEISVLQNAKVYAGVDNVAPIESVGLDGIETESDREVVMDEIDEIIQGLKGSITGIRDYAWKDQDTDIAETMSESGRVEEIEISMPSDDEVDFDPDDHDDEREAVLLAASDAIKYEIEHYISDCSLDAEKIISEAESEIEELEENLRDRLSETQQLLSEISKMKLEGHQETRKRVRRNRK